MDHIGLPTVLTLVIFFFMDYAIVARSVRNKITSATQKAFLSFGICVTIIQFCACISYSVDFDFFKLCKPLLYIINSTSIVVMVVASFSWFRYFVLSIPTPRKFIIIDSIIGLAPIAVMLVLCITGPFTGYSVFYIDDNLTYQPGNLLFFQLACPYFYVLDAVFFFVYHAIKGNGKQASRLLRNFVIYIIPNILGAVVQICVYRGGYTQIGASLSLLLMYLDQFMDEINAIHRLKSVQFLNDKLAVMSRDLEDRVNIIGSLSNAFFSCYAGDLSDGSFIRVKEIEAARELLKNCKKMDEGFEIFIPAGVAAPYVERMKIFTNYHTVAERLQQVDSISLEFQGLFPGFEWCRASWIVARRDSKGRAVKVLFGVEEISASVRERKRLEQEREKEQQIARLKLQTIADAIHGGFKVSKYDGMFTFVMVSDQLAQLLGYDSPEDMMNSCGGTMAGIVHHDDVKRELAQALAAAESGEMYTMHYRMLCKDYSWKNVEDRGRLITTSDGEENFWSFITDQDELTRNQEALEAQKVANYELQMAQTELQIARDQAEEASRAKTIFLNNMSHDIRTPMNAILGFSELMRREINNPEAISGYLDKIKSSGEYLLGLINNVLDMARIESGHITIEENLMDLSSAAQFISSGLDGLIRQKKHKLIVTDNIKHNLVIVDAGKVQEITMNLLSNAIKYTPEGGEIRMNMDELPGSRPGYAIYRMIISDNGIGMSPQFLAHIFDSFSRERNTTQSKVIGTGLGMSIVKKLIDLLGGTIEVNSEEGKGTEFIVTLENKYIEDPEEFASPEKTVVVSDENVLKGKKILLAEDNEFNAEIATDILEDEGFVVERAVDGKDCLEKYSAAAPGTYDVILMDIQMPNMNGYDATRNIRVLKDPAKAKIPILAMTADAFEEDKKKAFESGMNGHITKPINIEILLSELTKLFSQTS